MKKLTGILLTIMLCFTLSVCVFAVESNDRLDGDIVADIVDGLGKLVDAESEGNDEAIKEAIETLYQDLHEAQQNGNISQIIQKSVEYALDADTDLSDVFNDAVAVETVIKKVSADGSFDVEKIKRDLQSSSALRTLVNLYTGANPVRVQHSGTTSDAAATEYYQPEIVNPGTGDSGIGIAVALSIFSVSSLAVISLTKKKD